MQGSWSRTWPRAHALRNGAGNQRAGPICVAEIDDIRSSTAIPGAEVFHGCTLFRVRSQQHSQSEVKGHTTGQLGSASLACLFQATSYSLRIVHPQLRLRSCRLNSSVAVAVSTSVCVRTLASPAIYISKQSLMHGGSHLMRDHESQLPPSFEAACSALHTTRPTQANHQQ